MSHFVVSFRIDKDSTYQDRYDSLRDKVKEIATGTIWDETTSLYVFSAPGNSESVARSLYIGTKLDSSKDTLLVIDPHASTCHGYGIAYPYVLAAAIGIAKV
jgi:hypothetical protein